jgi:hypothetical protein
MSVSTARDDELIEVIRETVQQLEMLTRRLQSYVDNMRQTEGQDDA